jgi:hypothetical protein
MKDDIKSLTHTTYRCQHHIVFDPKVSQTSNIWESKGMSPSVTKRIKRAKEK